MPEPHPGPSRRAVLAHGSGLLALPLLPSLPGQGPRRLQPRLDLESRVRLGVFFMPNGVHVPSFRPRREGTDWELTPTLQPLAGLREELLVLTGLRNRNAFTGEGHYVKTTSLLSGARVRRTGGKDIRCGTSMDQLAAQRIGAQTPLPSLELSMDPISNRVDMGYSTVYGGHISWRSPTQPAAREIHPRLVFQRMFRAGRRLDPQSRLLLDTVLEDTRRLRPQLQHADRQKLDEYLQALHEVEQRIARLDAREARQREELLQGRRPESLDPGEHAQRVRLMLELMVLAFQSDSTRIASLMFGNAVSPRSFSFVDGVRGGFHPLSHHENKPEKQRQYALINRWHVAEYAWFLGRLKELEEAGQSLLDRSMILFASGLADGNRHDPKNLPVLLAGRGGGGLAPGRHLVFREDRRLCSLHKTLLAQLGITVDRFGDSDATLPQILARPDAAASTPAAATKTG